MTEFDTLEWRKGLDNADVYFSQLLYFYCIHLIRKQQTGLNIMSYFSSVLCTAETSSCVWRQPPADLWTLTQTNTPEWTFLSTDASPVRARPGERYLRWRLEAAAGSLSADTNPPGTGRVTRSPPTGRTRPPSRRSVSAAAGEQSGSPWQRRRAEAPWGPRPPASSRDRNRG